MSNIRITSLLVALLLSPVITFSQSQREVLTNTKIIEMVRLGLGEALIVAKINRSDCQCDTSTAAIGRLKTARVSDAIILAMMNAADASGFSDSRPPKPASRESVDSQVAGKDGPPPANEADSLLRQISEPGIYLNENGKLSAIEPTIFSGQKTSFLGTALTYGFKSAKIRAVVRGKSANLQLTNRRPEFYFSFSREGSNSGAVMAGGGGAFGATSPAEFILVEMRIRENSREAILGKASAMGASMGAPDKLIREYSFEKIKPGVYKVVPRADLAPGEYCFYYAGAGGAGGKLFDFSVK
jgi:hypothetical protein